MPKRIIAPVALLLLASPGLAQVGSMPPNAIDRATAADDARRATTSAAARAESDRAARDARDTATRTGPPLQSTMTNRPTGLNGSLTPPPAATAPPPPALPN